MFLEEWSPLVIVDRTGQAKQPVEVDRCGVAGCEVVAAAGPTTPASLETPPGPHETSRIVALAGPSPKPDPSDGSVAFGVTQAVRYCRDTGRGSRRAGGTGHAGWAATAVEVAPVAVLGPPAPENISGDSRSAAVIRADRPVESGAGGDGAGLGCRHHLPEPDSIGERDAEPVPDGGHTHPDGDGEHDADSARGHHPGGDGSTRGGNTAHPATGSTPSTGIPTPAAVGDPAAAGGLLCELLGGAGGGRCAAPCRGARVPARTRPGRGRSGVRVAGAPTRWP